MEDEAANVGGLPTAPLPPERLTIVELEGEFIVTSEDDPSDWVAVFSQHAEFPAREWAERMAELFNLRAHDEATHGENARDPNKPPIFWGSHHPPKE